MINMNSDIMPLDNQGYMALDRQKLRPLSTNGAQSTENLKKISQDFESVFLSQMFTEMFKGLGSDKMFGGGQSEETYRSMLLDNYAKQIVKHGGIGIADSVMRTLIHQQENIS
jgi:Rod binding domain-containing protein